MSLGHFSADQLKLIIFAGAGGAFGLWMGFKKLRLLRQIENTASSRAASAPQGHIELNGYAWPEQACFKNSKQFDCVYHTLKLEKQVKQGKNTKWITVYNHELGRRKFFVSDPSGAVLVDPQKVNLHPTSFTCGWRSATSDQRQFVKDLVGRAVDGFPPASGFLGLFSGIYRFTENYITLGSPLYAIGYLQAQEVGHQALDNVGLKNFATRLRRLDKDKVRMKAMLDTNRDGKVSEDEMLRGFEALARNAYHGVKIASGGEMASSTSIDSEVYKCFGEMISHNDSAATVYVGNEATVQRKLFWLTWGLIIGGGILSWISLSAIIFGRFF